MVISTIVKSRNSEWEAARGSHSAEVPVNRGLERVRKWATNSRARVSQGLEQQGQGGNGSGKAGWLLWLGRMSEGKWEEVSRPVMWLRAMLGPGGHGRDLGFNSVHSEPRMF